MDRNEQRPSRTNPNENRALTGDDTDLPDSPRDAERLKPDEAVLDLPDVSDIPGQEHVHVPPLDAIGDITPSSDDEEGTSVLGE